MPAAWRDERLPAARILIAGVGYPNLSDVSVGPVLSERLAQLPMPAGVEVHDYSFGAIDAVHRLKEAAYDRALFFGAVDRGDPPGTIRRYRWEGVYDPEIVQVHVAEAAQAVISLETTLMVTGYFQALPADTCVFEVEPRDFDFGERFSPEVEAAVRRLEEMLMSEVAAIVH